MPHTQKAPRTRELPSLTAPVDPARFVDVTGDRVALVGREEGPFECWIWPLKVVSELRFALRRAGRVLELPERQITVLPGELAYTWKGPDVQLRTEVFACRERPGMAFGFALDSREPLEVEVSFRCDLRPMWPAALGGQLARVDRVTGAFALTEELGRHAALIGASDARVELTETEHGLPDGLVRIFIPMLPGGSSAVLAIAGAEIEAVPLTDAERSGDGETASGFARAERAIGAARELWWRLVSDLSEEREVVRAHWRAHQQRTLSIETPYPALDQAFRWSQIAIERAWARVEGLGRGLVAGFGPSGDGERPGPAWFRDGDALVASRALSISGDFGAAREVLRFAAAHQRADGKLMHELTLSAGLCRWSEEYPYAYARGTSSADFVSALDLYVRFSGDVALARELMPAAKRALEWCALAVDQEGRLAGIPAGMTALESKPRDALASEAFVQGAWIAALGAAMRLAQSLGEDPAPYRELEEKARAGFEAYWSEERGHYGFALETGGRCADELSAYLGYPLSRGLGERTRAWASVQALNRPELMTDWGARKFACDPARDGAPERAAVHPYLTNFATLAMFAHGHAFAAHQVLFSQVALCHLGSLGLLDGRLGGERASAPAQAVPHQIASSAALVEATLLGLFGLEGSVAERRLTFRSTLPPHWDDARLVGVQVGETRCDVRLYRRREPNATVLGLELEHGEGPPLSIGFAPVLPPLSKLLDGPGWLRPSGAVVPRRLHRSAGEPLTLEARVLEGPAVLLPSTLPGSGEASRAARLVAQRIEPEGLTWTFAGPAGTNVALPFFCDFEVEVAGARLVDGELRLVFAPGLPGEWTETEVGVRVR